MGEHRTMMYWRNSTNFVKYLIVLSLVWAGFLLFSSSTTHARAVTPDRIPASAMPQAIKDYLLDCGGTSNAAAQIGWLSLEGQPSRTVTLVNYGTASVALQYNVAGIVCDSRNMGGLSRTNNGVIKTDPAGLTIVGKTLGYTYGSRNGDYSVTSIPFRFFQPGTFVASTDVTISITEKRINILGSSTYRCVTNPGDRNNRTPRNDTDYAACVSEGRPVVTVRVNVTLPPPDVSCTVIPATTTIFVGETFKPVANVKHAGPAGAPAVTVTGDFTVNGSPAGSIASTTLDNGTDKDVSGTSQTYNTAGTFAVSANFFATSSRPTVKPSCPGTLIVKLPPPTVECSVNNPSILAGESTPVEVIITNTSPARAPTLTYVATVTIDTKPNQTFSGSIANGGPAARITTANLLFGAGKFNVTVTVSGNASTSCRGVISSYNRPYVRTYNNDVLAGFGFYDGATCPTTTGTVSAFTRDAAQSYSGSGSQLGVTARGSINGFRTASTLASAASQPEILAFANTVLVNAAGGAFGGNFGSGVCMYNYWATSSIATKLNVANIDISTLANGRYYIKQVGGTPITVTGQITNGRKVVLYIEGTALLRGANVGYASTAWPATTDVPSLYIIAKGNIAVGSDVRNLDGHFIAQKSNNSDGRITSCVDPSTGQPFAAAAAHIANCSSKLVINGSFNAEHVNLLRTFNSTLQAVAGEPAASSNAAEVFVYPLESYLSSQSIDNTRQQTYDSITALPPSL